MIDKAHVRQKLLQARQELLTRVIAIDQDRRNETNPLDRDSEEQALQLENEEVLNALDQEGQEELDRIDRALQRLEEGTYGICVRCGVEIPEARLEAVPQADLCVDCANELRG